MIRVSGVSVTPGIRRGQRQFLLRWRQLEPGRPQEIREKCHYWFADREEAIEVRDAMRRGDTFETAFAMARVPSE